MPLIVYFPLVHISLTLHVWYYCGLNVINDRFTGRFGWQACLTCHTSHFSLRQAVRCWALQGNWCFNWFSGCFSPRKSNLSWGVVLCLLNDTHERGASFWRVPVSALAALPTRLLTLPSHIHTASDLWEMSREEQSICEGQALPSGLLSVSSSWGDLSLLEEQ